MEVLRNIYYKALKGSADVDELLAAARQKGIKTTRKQVEEFLKSQEKNQRFEKLDKTELFIPITAPPYTYQADLLFLTKEKKRAKKGWEYVKKDPVLVVVEISSRKGYFRYLRNKTSAEVAEAMESIIQAIQQAKQQIQFLEHDSGSEFIGKEFQRVLMDYDINSRQYPRAENSKTSLAKVERLNGTIRLWYNRDFRDRYSAEEAVKLIEDRYNNKKHRSTGVKPKHITMKSEYNNARTKDELKGAENKENVRKRYQKGMNVRLLEPSDIFKKKSEPKWSKKVYKITKNSRYNFNLNGDDEDFRAWQLLPVGKVAKAPKRKQPQKEKPIETEEPIVGTEEPPPLPKRQRTQVKPLNIAPTTAKPEPAVKKPAPTKGLKEVEFPIRAFEWIKQPKGERLMLKVKWKHLNEEENKQYENQGPEIFFLGTKKNPQLNKFFFNDLKKRRLFARFERAYGKMEISD